LWGHRREDVKHLAGHLVLAANGALVGVRPLQEILDDGGRVRPLEAWEADTVKRLLGLIAPRASGPEVPDDEDDFILDYPDAEVVLDLGGDGDVNAVVGYDDDADLMLAEASRPADNRTAVHIISLGMQFALVPAGSFWMSKGDRNAQRQVQVPHEFYMGIYT